MSDLNASSIVSKLYGAGPDAFSNQFDVVVGFPAALSSLENKVPRDAVTMRVKDFTPPSFKWGTYDFQQGPNTYQWANSKMEGKRQFSIEFRLDSFYHIYYALKEWKALIGDERAENISFNPLSADPDKWGTVEVYALASSSFSDSFIFMTDIAPELVPEDARVKWEFHQVKCIDVSEPKYSYSDANTIQITATFIFQDWNRILTLNDSLGENL
jgi:hypothetical protein